MENTIHFISGLPRAGSTLLAGILRQNPAFAAAMTSAVGSLYMALEGAMSRRNEASVFLDRAAPGAAAGRVRGVLSRGRPGDRDLRHQSPLVRAPCRPRRAVPRDARDLLRARGLLEWIVDSIERQAQRNPFELSGLFGFEPGGTVYTRVARIAGSEGMVGYALDALREACFGTHSERLILVDYEALTRAPGPTLRELYRLLGEPLFGHDFEDVHYEADAFDAALGAPGLHEVRRRVEWRPRPTVLPPDLFERFANDSFWRKPQPRLAHVPAILWRG